MSSTPRTSSLAERIREGDARAISTFRELHVRQMRAYCEVACSPQLVDEAIAAGFVDFLGRVTESRLTDAELDDALLRGTRSAAAARMPVDSAQPDCLSVPELLAAQANAELLGDDRALRDHLSECPVCQISRTRLDQAEQAFSPPEPEAEPVPELHPEPVAPASPPPAPPPAAPPAAPAVSARQRSGGLVRAVRKRIRPPLS